MPLELNKLKSALGKKYGAEKIKNITTIVCDRDGTINLTKPADPENPLDTGYILNPEQFKFIDKVGEGLKLFTQSGFKIHVFTQQSGVDKGVYSHADLAKVHDYMRKELLEHYAVTIGEITYCPHIKVDGVYQCLSSENPCVKLPPKDTPAGYRGQLGEIMGRTSLKPSEILVIGDTARDLPTAEYEAEGMMFIGVPNPQKPQDAGKLHDMGYPVAENMLDAATAVASLF